MKLRAALAGVVFCCAAHAPALAQTETPPDTLRGGAWWDADLDGRRGREEPGLAGIAVSARSAGRVLAHAVTARDGRFVLAVPARAESVDVDVTVPPGHFPTTRLRARGPAEFGLAPFRRRTIRAEAVSCLATGDLAEGDWPGPTDPLGAGDPDLIAGSGEALRRPLSIWFNHADHNGLFTTVPDEWLATPPLLALTLAPLHRSSAIPRRRDVVAGTAARDTANLLVWWTLGAAGCEGRLSASPSRAYLTEDRGDVQALVAWDVDQDGGVDLIAGTRSPGGSAGTIELWKNDLAADPGFARAQTLPRGTSIAELGQVTALARVGPLAGGESLLLAGTRTASGLGQIVVLGRDRETGRLEIRELHDLEEGAVTAITAADFDADGEIEIVVALEAAADSGSIQTWSARHDSASSGVTRDESRPVPFVPTRLAHADLGGSAAPDLVVAYRDAGGSGGLRVFSWDGAGSPALEFDPWAGGLKGTITALDTADFDGAAGARARADLVLGLRTSPHSGAVVLLAR